MGQNLISHDRSFICGSILNKYITLVKQRSNQTIDNSSRSISAKAIDEQGTFCRHPNFLPVDLAPNLFYPVTIFCSVLLRLHTNSVEGFCKANLISSALYTMVLETLL